MAVLVASNLLSAGTYVAGKDALRVLSPIELNFLRYTIAGLTFLPLLWMGGFPVTRDRLPRLALLCAFGFVLNKAAEFTGLRLSTASDTALLITAEGLFTVLFGWLLLHERLTRRAAAGLLFCVVGVYVVVERGLVLPHLEGGTRIVGDLLVVGALVFEALYTILGKHELQRYSGLVITATCAIGSLAVWTPAAGAEVAVRGLPHMDLTAWLGVLYLGIGGTTLAYTGWMVALRHVAASTAAPVLFVQPLVGSLLAILLLGERLTWATVAGGVCIVAGIWVVTRNEASASDVLTSAETIP